MIAHLREVASNVWIFPRDTAPDTVQPNVGVIRAATQTVLIDAGNSPQYAKHMQAALTAAGFPPVELLIYTHHHWDHVLGAMTFQPQTVIAHDKTPTLMQPLVDRSNGATQPADATYRNPYLDQINAMMDAAVGDWATFRPVLPTLTFSTSMTLHLDDDLRIDLWHVGGVHAPDSIVVRVPQSGVLFLGDSYYPPPLDQRTPENEDDLDTAMLDHFLESGCTIFIDGHGDPRDTTEMETMIAAEKARQGRT